MANGVIKKFEEEARKEGKASADFINNTIKQIRSDYAKTPVIKNNAVLSEAWSTITPSGFNTLHICGNNISHFKGLSHDAEVIP